MTEERPEHSPLGASGAYRWMNCPGSNTLMTKFGGIDEPSEYALEGTAAHAAAEHCLDEDNQLDTWEIVGQEFLGYKVGQEMASGVQLYLDEVRSHLETDQTVMFLVEVPIDTDDHQLLYGTLDAAVIEVERKHVVLRDFKYGFMPVEVEENAQLMYYAFGLLRQYPWIETVDLGIVQPRGFHEDGPIRRWFTTAEHIIEWGENELLPAMLHAETDTTTISLGGHCHFCPVKLVCPKMKTMYAAAAQAEIGDAKELDNDQLGADYGAGKRVTEYIKAVEEEAFRRNSTGSAVPGTKLVTKQAKRVWNKGVEKIFKKKFGDKCHETPKFKSPAKMELLGSSARKLVAEHAYKPHTGLTIALADDKRVAVKVKPAKEVFAHATGEE